MNNNIFYRKYMTYYPYSYNHKYYTSTNYFPYYKFKNNENYNLKNIDNKDLENDFEIKQDLNIKDKNKDNLNDCDSIKEENNTRGFKLGPIRIYNNRISGFGYSFAIDDLIIVALIVFLLLESNCDYTLLIVLGLMLFDFSISSLNLFS